MPLQYSRIAGGAESPSILLVSTEHCGSAYISKLQQVPRSGGLCRYFLEDICYLISIVWDKLVFDIGY